MQALTTWKTTSCVEKTRRIELLWLGEKLVNGSNSRTHPLAKAQIASRQRQGALHRLQNILRHVSIDGPYEVKITRIAPRFLDSDDNLNISAKHIRDGVSDALGVNDGDKTKISFSYAQEKSTETTGGKDGRVVWVPGVRVEISTRVV